MTFFGVVASGTLPTLTDDVVSLRLPAVSGLFGLGQRALRESCLPETLGADVVG